MRDIAIYAVIFSLLPICLVRPYVGVLAWAWIGYMNPHKLTWGAAYNFPFAQLVALATIAGIAFLYFRPGPRPKMLWERETILLILLWIMFTITTFFALIPDDAWQEWEKITKILLMTFLTIALVDSKKKLRYLLMVIALSIGYYGFKGGIFSILTGGQYRIWGPQGSFIEDNNAIGLALNMSLPLLYYLAQGESNKYLKRFLQLTFFLSILSVMFTYSRGAFLGLVVVFTMMFLSMKFRNKVAIVLLLVFMFPIAINNVPDKWMNRMDTLNEYQEDGSAMGRIQAWTTAWEVAKARPFTGGGFQIIDDLPLMQLYNPDANSSGLGVHSVYFEVLSENGFITFIIFMALLFSAIGSTRKVRRICKNTENEDLIAYSYMLETSLWAYAASGAFLELASFDMFYHIIAMIIILKAIARKAIADPEKDTHGHSDSPTRTHNPPINRPSIS